MPYRRAVGTTEGGADSARVKRVKGSTPFRCKGSSARIPLAGLSILDLHKPDPSGSGPILAATR